MHLDMSAYALRVLAPCILIVALLGVLRGFFQGMGSMIPTAISQVIEQIVNAVISIAGAYLLFNAGRAVGKTRGDKSFGPAYAAAGGTLGTVLGALSAFDICRIHFSRIPQSIQKENETRSFKEKRKLQNRIQSVVCDHRTCHFKCNGI